MSDPYRSSNYHTSTYNPSSYAPQDAYVSGALTTRPGSSGYDDSRGYYPRKATWSCHSPPIAVQVADAIPTIWTRTATAPTDATRAQGLIPDMMITTRGTEMEKVAGRGANRAAKSGELQPWAGSRRIHR